ncbi:preprotein translocase subunit SecG [Undibacterium sp. SXout20W]|uniref:preprotein translocase subunit SecG n=1 Tax=Undibacterium sp. SXout20W TaxID=3413051 RepID=UPI003BF20E41
MQTFFTYTLIVIVQVLSALAIIGLVLLQHGKGADMGASFGSGASGSLFGATGSSNFLSRSTGVAAALFFFATLMLGVNAGSHKAATGVMDGVSVVKPAPAVNAAAAAASAASVLPANQIPK